MITRLHGVPAARTAALVLFFFATALSLIAQQQTRKEFAFRGRVEQVDAAAKRLTVHNEAIEGWMGGMTMAYRVSNEDVLSRLKPGDQITAKVYAGDFTLYDVAPVPPTAGAPTSGAPQAATLRLADLEQMALANNPTVAQAQANLRVGSRARKTGGVVSESNSRLLRRRDSRRGFQWW